MQHHKMFQQEHTAVFPDGLSKKLLSQYAHSIALWKPKLFKILAPLEIAGIRDNFTTSTWLLLGASLQSFLLLFLPTHLAIAPALIILGYRLCDNLLMTLGVTRNVYMEGTINGRFSVHFPNEEGKMVGEPANEQICVLIIGARTNHPLGKFSSDPQKLAVYFGKNVANLERNAEKYGFLGMSGWLNGGDRASASENMMVGYFKNVEGLNRFAHGESHRKGWKWWEENIRDLDSLSIMHEIFMVDKKNWEAIYVNYKPTGLGATTIPRTLKGDEKPTWFSPIVKAEGRPWKSSYGRMNRSKGTENDKYEEDLKNNTESK